MSDEIPDALQARADRFMGLAKCANTPRELAAAHADGEAILADLGAFIGMRKAIHPRCGKSASEFFGLGGNYPNGGRAA